MISETGWSLNARLILVAALLFIGLNYAQVIYRMTLPSLGWVGLDPEEDSSMGEFRLVSNAVGAPSALQPDDIVLKLNGVSPTESLEAFSFTNIPSGWQVGGEVRVEIARDGQPMELDVPVVRWTPQAWLAANLGDFSGLWNWFSSLLIFGVGAFTFFKRPGNLSARFLFMFGLANLSITLSGSLPDFLELMFDPLAAYARAIFSNVIFAYLLAPSFLGFSLTFPRAKDIVRRIPALLPAAYMIGLIPVVMLIIDPELATIGFLLTALMLVSSVVSLVHTGLTARDAVSRAQLRWAVGGTMLGVGLFLLNFATVLLDQEGVIRQTTLWIAGLGQPIVGISLSIAILRHRLFDIDVIIRRTLQYALLTALMLVLYYGGIVVLQGILGPLTGDTRSPLITVITTLGLAALFNPLRLRIQDFIDRRFFRKKYDAEKALNQFALITRDQVDLDRITGGLLALVDETMQPDNVSLWLRQGGRKHQAGKL